MAMPKSTLASPSALMDDLRSTDKDRQNHAFQSLSEMTKEPVDWAYDIWDELLRLISEGDNRQRSIAGQLLSNLVKSDRRERILEDAGALLALANDERFVTARHVLLSLWKIAVEGDRQRETITDGLAHRFRECATEKNSTLIRYDIQCVLRRIYDLTGDERVRSTGEELMKLEQDTKYKKKYATAWRSAPARPRKQSSGTRSRSTRSSRIRKKFSPL
jgi:hypothetical protein